MASILILYSTTDGHTLCICQRLTSLLRQHGHAVNLSPLAATPPTGKPHAVLIGASIRYGHHQPAVGQYLQQHRHWLAQRLCGLFSVSLAARKPQRRDVTRNPYLQRLLAQVGWRPPLLAIFAGKLDYPRYRWLDRQIIRLIMYLTHGPTDPRTVHDYTDWQAVAAFAESVHAQLTQK